MSQLPINADNGIKNINSNHDVKATADRLEDILKAKGMDLVARVDHAAGAEKVGKKLRPTELIIFGNPQAGTALMQNKQSVGLDLPQKVLIWEDDQGKVWLSYNDPNYLMSRHGINGCNELINNIGNALASITNEASA
jgi:uncharacterized protein (DUF302 family)